jgi:hypothetical protein
MTATRNVNEIPADERKSLENLLGASLDAGQQVLILTYKPNSLPEDAVRRSARERIAQTLLVNQRFAEDQGLTGAEADEAVLEAMSHARPRP